jgi:hypothetical protein
MFFNCKFGTLKTSPEFGHHISWRPGSAHAFSRAARDVLTELCPDQCGPDVSVNDRFSNRGSFHVEDIHVVGEGLRTCRAGSEFRYGMSFMPISGVGGHNSNIFSVEISACILLKWSMICWRFCRFNVDIPVFAWAASSIYL